MKKILLFTGAGMSVQMDLPASTGFANTIRKCDANLMNLLVGHLDNSNN
jgi:NAD-dependent SIR2 family protein deacetylase